MATNTEDWITFTVTNGSNYFVPAPPGARAAAAEAYEEGPGHYIFRDEANAFQVVPIRPAGWEDAGAKPKDQAAVTTVDLQAAVRAMAQQAKVVAEGRSVTQAICALHGQRRADGRPHTYLP